jgi:hypothetical protein
MRDSEFRETRDIAYKNQEAIGMIAGTLNAIAELLKAVVHKQYDMNAEENTEIRALLQKALSALENFRGKEPASDAAAPLAEKLTIDTFKQGPSPGESMPDFEVDIEFGIKKDPGSHSSAPEPPPADREDTFEVSARQEEKTVSAPPPPPKPVIPNEPPADFELVLDSCRRFSEPAEPQATQLLTVEGGEADFEVRVEKTAERRALSAQGDTPGVKKQASDTAFDLEDLLGRG